MNCNSCQRLLLLQADFEPVPAEVAAHLAQCRACRRWQDQLVRIEKVIPTLPVPPSQRKEAFQTEVLRGVEAEPVAVPMRRRWNSWQWRAAVSVAAGIVVLAGAFLVNSLMRTSVDPQPVADQSPPPKKPRPRLLETTLTAKLLNKNLDLSEETDPEKRLATLSSLASAIQDEGRSVSDVAEAKDLDKLAELYGKIVDQGIVARAKALPQERRRSLDRVRDKLAEAGKEAEKLARDTAPEKAEPWLKMAAISRRGQDQLSALLEEATP